MRHNLFFWIKKTAIILMIFPFFLPASLVHAKSFSFSIKGEVQHPGIWSVSDLEKLPTIDVTVREYSAKGNYLGLSRYYSVPLLYVLEKAEIKKSLRDAFKHKSDMAIHLKNRNGKEIVLSWGEIFYQSNPTNYLLTVRKSVVRPSAHPKVNPGSCSNCHNGHIDKNGRLLPRVLSESLSGVKFLIIRDGRLVTSLDNLNSMEVRSVNRRIKSLTDRNNVFSEKVVVVKWGRVSSLRDLLKQIPPNMLKEYTLPEIGSGCGYHGTFTFEGYPLENIFGKEIASPEFWGLLISAPDGYRTFVSRGEILGYLGRKALLAFSRSGHNLEKPEGKYMLILPNDVFFDRWIRAVNRIEILSRAK